MLTDTDALYRACAGRERRFDGHVFLAVTSTGIYCRPSCPARTPRRENCRFFATAAAAVAAGYRACRRCRPDALPGSRRWDESADLASRALRAIRDGVVDEVGVAGLAAKLGVSERHLHRLLVAEIGASASQLNRTRRMQVARALLDQTPMPVSDIAFAAGFGSIRQFNETFAAEFGCAPSALRRRRPEARAESADALRLTLHLPFREPYCTSAMRAVLAAHAVVGLERVDADTHHRRLDGGDVAVRWGTSTVIASLRLIDVGGVLSAVTTVRRWLDLDGDPILVDEHLASVDRLAALVAARPGLRVPGAVDPAEFAFFTVLGQQISLASARTVQARLVATFGADPAALAAAGPGTIRETLRLTRAKAATMHALAVALAGGLDLGPGADRAEARRALLALPGVGEWTAEFIAMRAMADPDACPSGDLVLQRTLGLDRPRDVRLASERWRPFRSYAVMHLWTKENYL